MKTLLLVIITVFVTNVMGISQDLTYTALNGTITSDGTHNIYLIKPIGATKIELTISYVSFESPDPIDPGSTIIFYADENYNKHLFEFTPSNIYSYSIPITVTSTGNAIPIMVMWQGNVAPQFVCTYKAILPAQWSYVGSSIYTTGNVGIGTSTPENSQNWSQVLDVHGSSNSKIIATTDNGSINAGLWAHSSGFFGAPAGGMIGTASNHPISFITNSTSKATLLANGNFGIGMVPVSEKLEVAGNVKATFFIGDGSKLTGITSSQWTTNGTNITFNSGNVLIGKTTQTATGVRYKLDVAGPIRVDEVSINTNGADFVFEQTYKLRSLAEVETFIKHHRHLPDIASAAEMQINGINIGDIQTKLLQKIEELTLYSIEQEKQIAALKAEKDKRLAEQNKVISEQEKKFIQIEAELQQLKNIIKN